MTRPALLLILFCLGQRAAAEDYGFSIQRAELVHVADHFVLAADIDYRFNPPAIEALENGIPLTLAVNLIIRRERPFWLDETIANERRLIEIRYHPLAKSFQITDQASGAAQNFASLSTLLDTLNHLRGWSVLADDQLNPATAYLASLSISLDIESLPLPLRAVAYLSPEWHLSSPAYEWSVKP
ncbi:MAG: DUF4390 domain-containing protein [Methylococcaceae bacterium]|jgi:hypothetical protein